MEHFSSDLPVEIIELILAFVFDSYVLEDERIQDRIIQYLLKKSPLKKESHIKLESVFKRQADIYKCAANLSTVCKPYWKAMRESNIIWSRIFSLTIGARSWLSKAPYIFEKRFNSSYKQMCKFLMTFGDKLTDIKFEKLDLGLRGSVEKVGPRAFICAGNDSKLSRYDFSTGEVTLLTSTQETDGLLRDKYLITFDVQFNVQMLSMKIYDYEEDKLLQSYDDVINLQTEHGPVSRWVTRHAGDWIELTAEVGNMRCEALVHVLARISQHQVVVVPPYERCTVVTLKEAGKSFCCSVKDKTMVQDRYRVKILKIEHNRELFSATERDPFTNKVLSTLPFRRCRLLGNYALSKTSTMLYAVSTSIRAGKQISATNAARYYIRGDCLYYVEKGDIYVHVLEYSGTSGSE